MSRWPFPRMFAHRGGGRLAPENTLAALRCGHAHGYRAVEFDVMLAADGVPVLMHDPEFGRTVAGPGAVATTRSADLGLLDAGRWFGAEFAGEPVPLYSDAVAFCRAHGLFMNVEIKPAPGDEEATGRAVATLTRQLYAEAPEAPVNRPLFSSFSTVALAAARDAAPEFARGHLFDALTPGWLDRLRSVEAMALHCNHRAVDAALVGQVRALGLGLFCYTVNDVALARALMGLGVDALCTDRIDLIPAGFA